MRRYRAQQVVTLASGSLVALDDKQAADRKGRIERLAPGRYRLKDALQFKAGEAFGYEGDLPKAVAAEVEPVAEPAEKSAAAERKTK